MKGEAFGLPAGAAFAQMMRKDCTECGSTDLAWVTALDLLHGAIDPQLRADLREMVAMCGGDADAWVCRTCAAGYGVFGPTQFEGFENN